MVEKFVRIVSEHEDAIFKAREGADAKSSTAREAKSANFDRQHEAGQTYRRIESLVVREMRVIAHQRRRRNNSSRLVMIDAAAAANAKDGGTK